VPLNSGGPHWHPSGRYIIFTAEKAKHGFVPAGSTMTDAGAGIYNDLTVLNLQTHNITRLNNVGTGLLGAPTGGSLLPKFSHSGTKIAWGDYIGIGSKKARFGNWRIAVADFSTTPEPHIENVKYYKPGPRPEFFEIQGWTPNDKAVVFACAPLPGQDDN